MTIGMSVTVSETVVPMSAVSATGSTSARPSARRSRSSCVSSLRAWAMMRRIARLSGGDAALFHDRALLYDREENILQRVVVVPGLEHAHALAREPRRQLARRRLGVAVDDDMEAVAEQGDAPGLHLALEDRDGAQRVVGAHLEHAAALRGLHPARCALGHQLAGDHESQPIALLGLFEIVRGDE